MTTKIFVGVASVAVVAAIIGAVVVLQGRAAAPTSDTSSQQGNASGSESSSSASQSEQSASSLKCPVTPGKDATALVKTDDKVGSGKEATAGSTVSVRYTGCLADGTVFDSTKSRGDEPISFGLNQVIKGWTDGIPGMKVGGVRTLVIPPDQGYGDSGAGTIPGGATLTFQVELVDVK